jgi:hypothetical protein
MNLGPKYIHNVNVRNTSPSRIDLDLWIDEC